MGITVENSEDYQSPYCRASFYPTEDAAIGSYYAQFWDEELQQHKLIINPNELNEDDLQNDARLYSELGANYHFQSKPKTIYDILMKRLSYDGDKAMQINYGLKNWAMIDASTSTPIYIDATNVFIETSLVQVSFFFIVESRRFGIVNDIQTSFMLPWPYVQDAAPNVVEED